MKILLLCWRDTSHPYGGGSERYLERVGEYLAARGHRVIYRTASFPGAQRHELRRGIAYSRAGGRFSVYPLALGAILLGRLGWGSLRGIDAVVDTNNGIPFFAHLVAGVPVVMLTHHCHREQWPVAGPLWGRVGWFLESRVVPRLLGGLPWVTVSPSSLRELAALGVPEGNIRIIHNGVDPVPNFASVEGAETAAVGAIAQPAGAPTPADTTAPAPRRVVTLCRLVPHKQIEHAMDAVAALPANIHLDVIGSGWWEERLRAHAAAVGLGERVTFHGHVSEERKHALLDRAEVHLLPSRKEGWGIAVMEAAQHGVPTIGYASAVGLRDSIAHQRTGLLAGSPEELAADLRILLDNPAYRRRLGEAARRVARGFSWQDTGEKWLKLLRGLSNQRRRCQ